MAIDSMARGCGNWLKTSFRASSSGGGLLRDEKGEPIHFDCDPGDFKCFSELIGSS